MTIFAKAPRPVKILERNLVLARSGRGARNLVLAWSGRGAPRGLLISLASYLLII